MSEPAIGEPTFIYPPRFGLRIAPPTSLVSEGIGKPTERSVRGNEERCGPPATRRADRRAPTEFIAVLIAGGTSKNAEPIASSIDKTVIIS